jgi:hypothetical protein
MRADTHSPTAARPEPGTLWAWEPHSLTAAALIEVTQLRWNGEEWWVEARVIAGKAAEFAGVKVGSLYWNELSRFWEACYRVSKSPGLLGHSAGIRRGPLQVGERMPGVPAARLPGHGRR